MLSDEEKNVIDLLKNIDKQKCLMLNCPVVKNNIERQLKIIELNRIIRKQSKAIEELKKQDLSNSKIIANMSTRHFNDREKIRKYEALQDKIKAKIEELDYNDIGNFERRCKQEVLQSLKEQIIGLRSKYHVDGWFEDDYISKDKIKAKIEEVEQWELYNMKIPRLSTLDERLGAKIGIKYVLQSLLEKE